MSDLAVVAHVGSGLAIDSGLSANDFVEGSISDNTRIGYASDWRQFQEWCSASGVQALPASPAVCGDYFAYMANIGRASSSIDRSRAALRMSHEILGFEDPTSSILVRKILSGIRRKIGTARVKKAPVLSADIKLMVDALPSGLLGCRDKALLLIGFAGAFRRSELVGLTVENVEFSQNGARILLPFSKTDNFGEGRYVAIKRGGATCPVAALEAWLAVSGITSGPVFRQVNRHGKIRETALTAQVVPRIVKRAAVAVGLNPDNLSGHSLRAGFVTQCALVGVSESNIMRQTGHKSSDTVRGYVRIACLFQDNPSGSLGL